MEINGYYTSANYFALDGCHKFYLLEFNEVDEAQKIGYQIHPIEELPIMWIRTTCPLKFINTWDLLNTIVPQFNDVKFIV